LRVLARHAACASPFCSDQAAFGEGNRLARGDDEVVNHAHLHQTERGLQRSGQQVVGPRGLRTAAGMVVIQDRCAGILCQSALDHFTRIDRRLGQGAPEQLLRFDEPVLRIEPKDAEDFMFDAADTQTQIVADRIRCRENHGVIARPRFEDRDNGSDHIAFLLLEDHLMLLAPVFPAFAGPRGGGALATFS